MDKLLLIGGGGHCKSVLDAALREQRFGEILITDPGLEVGTKIFQRATVIGGDEMIPVILKKWEKNGERFGIHLSVGGVKTLDARRTIDKRLRSYCGRYISVVDPSAVISKNAQIADGTFIGKNAVINAEASVGRQTIVNTGAIIEHDCTIGAFSHISVGAKICGDVKVGECVFIGAGAVIIQGLKIGNHAIVGAGSVVLRDIEPHEKMAGVIGG